MGTRAAARRDAGWVGGDSFEKNPGLPARGQLLFIVLPPPSINTLKNDSHLTSFPANIIISPVSEQSAS